jgi:conjugal transfer/entry exclusion protein
MIVAKIITSFIFYTVAIVVTAAALMALDYSNFNGLEKEKGGLNSMFQQYFDRLYFASTTFSTVGYGDITPKSNVAKFITILLQFVATIGVISIIIF